MPENCELTVHRLKCPCAKPLKHAHHKDYTRSDAFVAKLTASGSGLVYSTYLGGSSYDGGFAIAVDAAGNAYVTGYTGSSDFPTTAGALGTTFNGGGSDAFVAKLTASGSGLVYSTYLGGSGNDWGYGIAVDAAGNAYVTGGTYSSDFPKTPGALDTTYNGGYDAFVAKFSGFPPPPPTGQKTTALVNESEVSWNAVPGAGSYQVWRNTTNNSATATEIASGIKDTTYDDATATPGITYYYWVIAAQGSLSSLFGTPVTGVANAGSGPTLKLGGLELLGNFSLGSGSTYTANGTIEIGFAPASGQTFQPLLTVDGSVSYDNSIISVEGTVSADIGNLSLPLLSGSFEIPLAQAGETDTSPNTVNDTHPNNSEEIAGLPIQITSLALIPAGSGVSSPEIEVKGDISLLNRTLSTAVLITEQGLQLESAKITLPETSFSVERSALTRQACRLLMMRQTTSLSPRVISP